MRKVITYGTFDLFHIGHLKLLRRLRMLGDHLSVGVSTDEFNALKGKKTVIPFADRAEIVRNISGVDEVFPEENWAQKRIDIVERKIDIFGIGDDWYGKFDHLRDLCNVVYLERTPGISSTLLKSVTRALAADGVPVVDNQVS